MGAGIYAAYRKGLLKPIIKSGVGVLETIASGTTDRAYQFTNAIKRWTQEEITPGKSIFRGNNLENFRDVLNTTLDKKTINNSSIKNIIDDTVDDVNRLSYLIRERQTNINKIKENYAHTDLANAIKELKIFSREIDNNLENEVAKDTAKGIAVQELLTNPKYHLSHEAEKKSLKRTGMRSLMLEDIFEKPDYDEAGRLILKERIDAPISLADNDIEGTRTIDLINSIIGGGSHGEYRYFKNGKGTTLAGDWESFGRTILDEGLMIDESGKLIDVRMSMNMKNSILRSAVTDFKIPGLGFNPIATWTDWGRTEQNKLFGLLDAKSFQPFITGKAGKYALGNITDNQNLIFVGDKIYSPNAKNGFDLFEEGFKFHDVSRANEYGFNSTMRSTIKMADLDSVEVKRKSNRHTKADDLTDKVYDKLRFSKVVKDVEDFNPDGSRMDPDRLNLDYFISPKKMFTDKVINPFYAKISPYEKPTLKEADSIFNIKLNPDINFTTGDVNQARKFVAVKKGMNIHDIKETNGVSGKIDFMKEYLSQGIAGKSTTDDMIGNFTESSASIYNLFDSVFDRLGNIAPMLRFDNKDKGNLAQYMFNIAAFRIAPIYLATQVPEMLNALSEPIFSVLGFNRQNRKEDKYNDNRMNLGKFIMADIVKPIDVGFHNVKDMLGITTAVKKFEEFVPASDQISELPGIYQLGLGQTKEEREEYIEKGYDPIRKGRYWSMGNCVVPFQEIQTSYGRTTLAKDVKEQDEVITHEGILKPVLHVMTREMRDDEWTPEIELYTTIFNNITTDNHPYLAVKQKYCPATTSFKYCRPDRNSAICDKRIYPNYCSKRAEWNTEWILARDLEPNDWLAYPRIKILNTHTEINGLPANNEIGYMLGLFLAEGNIHTWHKNGKTYGIELTLNNAEINLAQKFKNILDKYFPNTNTNIKFNKNKGNGVIKLRNLSTKVSEWFRSVLYPEYKGNKNFISNIYYYNEEFILSVITGMLDGDGHYSYKNNTLQLAYTSHRIEYIIQLRNILFSLGIENSIVHCNKIFNGKQYTGYRLFVTGDAAIKLNDKLDLYKTKGIVFSFSNNVSKYIYIDENYAYIKIKSIKDNGYRGIVYDYEIQDSHTFCSLSTIMHNTPYTGGKIDYWRPNIYRRVAADVKFSDSKWGSRQEYYNNTWFPNPINPLAPLNHFLVDRDHYDMKHYYDRPYLMTSTKGENIPLVGHLFAGTIGSIGQTRMHEEYWQNNKPVEKNDEAVPIITETRVNTAWNGVTDTTMGPSATKVNPRISRKFDKTKEKIPGVAKAQKENYITLNRINENLNADQLAQETVMLQEIQNVRQQMMRGEVKTRDIMSEGIPIVPMTKARTGGRVSANILPTVTDNSFTTYNQTFKYHYQDAENNVGDLELYTTPSGAISVVDVPANLDIATANAGVSTYSIRKLIGTNERVQVNDPNRFAPQLTDYSNVKINNDFMYQLGEQYNNTTDLFGMKGFELRTFVTGEANQGAKVIENSNYAYSFNKSFWDMNLGGFGGPGETGEEASEIFRRFVQKRNTSTEFINPIRNTMPSWLPGRDYFLDLKHGDSYSKIANGEERLPGEGYERLYDINQEEMFNLRIGSSYIGKSEDEMIKHLLGIQEMDLDSTDLPFHGGSGVSAAESGTKMHEKVEKAWLDAGIAIETEGKVEDEQHNILGFYDAKVKDITSWTGVGIVDIKTVNAEKFAAVAESGQALYEHQSQVNYYLWATGNKRSNGYVYYINRDDPTQTMTIGFKYNADLLRENLETLSNARNKIYQGLQDGTIGRGELYDPIDRLRILADVAPYSQEYEDAKAAVAFSGPNAEEQREISAINDRVKQQKEPLRLYPYKFSNVNGQNLVTEKVQVKEIIDNNHILVKQYGKEHSISFAGINISQSNSTMYDDKRTMNEAARKQLKKYIKRGREITITYDANNKFNNDSTKSIKSVINVHGKNVNQIMLNKGLATNKDKDDPASIMATYSSNEIAVGSALEKLTHTFAQIPFVGNKWLQAKSPYEQYRDREVYGKIS